MTIGAKVTVAKRFVVTTMVSVFCRGIAVAGVANTFATMATLNTAQPNKLAIMPKSLEVLFAALLTVFMMFSVGFDVVFLMRPVHCARTQKHNQSRCDEVQKTGVGCVFNAGLAAYMGANMPAAHPYNACCRRWRAVALGGCCAKLNAA